MVWKFSLDPLRDRSLSEGEESLLELLVRSVVKEPEGASAGGGIVNDLGNETVVIAEIELVANPYLARRLHDYIPETLLAVELAEQEYRDVGIGLFLLAEKLGRKYLRVVKHEAVALAEIFYYVLENPVFNFARILVQDKKLAFIAPAGRLFCDLLTWKIELEL